MVQTREDLIFIYTLIDVLDSKSIQNLYVDFEVSKRYFSNLEYDFYNKKLFKLLRKEKLKCINKMIEQKPH